MKTHIYILNLEEIIKYIFLKETDLFLFMIDKNIDHLYSLKDFIESSPFARDLRHYLILNKTGENIKTLEEYQKSIDFFLQKDIHRKAHLIVFGGGSLSDLGGFVAATLLRGLQWSVVPTTLLAMIDASIGGKVGINSSIGKNLIGQFHLPCSIFINTQFLTTLPLLEILSGRGELMKYAFLDQTLSGAILENLPLDELIIIAAKYKNAIVQLDPQEKDLRKFLNFGHTFGHALEQIYTLPHGIAVYWGIFLKFKYFQNDNFCEQWKKFSIKFSMHTLIAPWKTKPLPCKLFFEHLLKDKKRFDHRHLCFVLVEHIGKPFLIEEKLSVVEKKLKNIQW